MLTTLRIKNLALVAELTLDLPGGYVAITGETGAGKSILLGALNLLLGERADRDLIRSGADSCTVEAVFALTQGRASALRFLAENGIELEPDEDLILKRSFAAAGTNRQFINGSPTTLSVLQGLGDLLVDMHGPYEHQSLLQPAKQLAILDAFGNLEPLRARFAAAAAERAGIENRKAELIVDEQTYAQQVDLLRHQVNEISVARLRPEEETELEPAYRRASQAAKLAELAQAALNEVSESDQSLLTQAGALGRTLLEMRRLDTEAACLLSLHEQASSFWRDLRSDLSHYLDRIDLDPAHLAQLEERCSLVQSLKRKYGATIDEIVRFGENAAAKLQTLERRDAEVQRLAAELERVNQALDGLGRQLTSQRRAIAPKLTRAAMAELGNLGFRQCRFEIDVRSLAAVPREKGAICPTGLDTIEFLFAPNPGEPARPLRAMASSGEMARVMLALKTVLAAHDGIPVLVFDEVDANIGGETAHAVGRKMRQIGHHHQVLCVSHLAPVAACAEHHFAVTKEIRDGRTFTEIRPVTRAERIEELARMLGGAGDAARRHAEALLAAA